MDNGKRTTDLVEQARKLRLQAEDLEKSARLARGTQRINRPTGQVIVKPARGPHWVGDEGPTEELMAVIGVMLQERPWRFQELLAASQKR